MKVFLLLAVVVLIHGGYASLVIKGPTGPVVQGQKVLLECQYKDSEHDIRNVFFHKANQPDGEWHRLNEYLPRCILDRRPGFPELIGNIQVFNIIYVGAYYDGYYRCVNENETVTAPDNASQVLHLKVHYLQNLHIIKGKSYFRYDAYFMVETGDDVELKCGADSSEEPIFTWTMNGSDWILPSSTLSLKNISAQDAGQYMCLAKHPLYPHLRKTLTATIELIDWSKRMLNQDEAKAFRTEDTAWYKTSIAEVSATMAAVAVCLLVFVLSISIFLFRRLRKARTSKGPIDDHSQKKPIYKTSVDSLPSTCGDAQPLV